MLIGATGGLAHETERLERAAAEADAARGQRARDAVPRGTWLASEGARVGVRPWGVPTLDACERVARHEETGSWLACSGQVFRDRASAHDGPPGTGSASLLLERLLAKGAPALAELEGSFALAFFDARTHRVHLACDPCGSEPLHYGLGRDGALFGSGTRELMASGLLAGGLCPHGLAELLAWGFMPGGYTLDTSLRRVRPGEEVVLDTRGNVLARERWCRLSFAPARETDERILAAALRTAIERAVARRLPGGRAGAGPGDPHSERVQVLARRVLGERLHELDPECAEEDALAVERAVLHMDAPCGDPEHLDAWLLGREAEGRCDFVLTGHGGDWLRGDDPAYAAQRLRAGFERLRLPELVDGTLRRLRRRLGAGDREDGVRATLDRLLPPAGLPRDLGPFRWRCRFGPGEILALVSVETARELAPANPFRSLLDAYEEYDGPDDGVSPHRHAELVTGAGGILGPTLVRGFGVETRTPLRDREVMEEAAAVPAHLGPERVFDLATSDLLPSDTAQAPRPPGAAQRVRGWLRGEGPLGRRVSQVLSDSALRARGLLRPEPVQEMLRQHRAGRHDHGQRLWTLFVLELWLRAREGRSGA